MKKNILVIGGAWGVGLKLAEHYVREGHTVCITGQQNPHLAGAQFHSLALTDRTDVLGDDINRLLAAFPDVNTLIYTARDFERGHIGELTDDALCTTVNVGLLVPMLLVQRLKARTDGLLKVMLVTSGCQYTPDALQPAYCAVQAGLGMFGASLGRDRGIGKVLVAAPSAINIPVGDAAEEDAATMLTANWVADQIVALSGGAFKFKYARILSNPDRVDVVECLDNDFQNV